MRAAVGVLVVCVWAALTVGCAPRPAPAPDPMTGEWPIGPPAAHGLDSARLSALVDRIAGGRYGAVNGLLVARHGVLVLERYFRGYGPDELRPLESVTKSVASALVGLAVDDGRIASLDAAVCDVLPAYADLCAADPGKRAISLAHVLTMTAGLAWDEESPPGHGPEERTDWMRVVLRQPLVDPPGTRFRYSSGSALLLSGLLERVYGVSAVQVASRHLFGPLGITRYVWLPLGDGLTPTGGGLALRPRDLAKLGQLFLDSGTFRGRRILSAGWVRRSTSAHLTLPRGSRYGYLWRLPPEFALEGVPLLRDAYYAGGFGDQFLFVLPSAGVVVVVTAENYAARRIDPDAFLTNEVVPVIQGGR